MVTRLSICAFILFVLFVWMNSVRSASNEQFIKDCKAQANWALMLSKDKETIPLINVMPKDQHILDLVEAHKGTAEELWWLVYYDCKGIHT